MSLLLESEKAEVRLRLKNLDNHDTAIVPLLIAVLEIVICSCINVCTTTSELGGCEFGNESIRL